MCSWLRDAGSGPERVDGQGPGLIFPLWACKFDGPAQRPGVACQRCVSLTGALRRVELDVLAKRFRLLLLKDSTCKAGF
jgi:hypothetical protein